MKIIDAMLNVDFIHRAYNDYSKAQDLAIKLKEDETIFTPAEIRISREIFRKWFLFFSEKAKQAKNVGQKRNFSYLKNKFLNYYRLATV